MSGRESLLRAALRLTLALTLRNPWAHLITYQGKDVENRSWMPPEHLTTLLIHAGKGWDGGDWSQRVGDRSRVATSAIVAVADLAHACRESRYAATVRCSCGPWAMAKQCHWVLANVRALAEPVPCMGRQGLWRPTPEVADAIADQLAPSAVGGKPKAPSKESDLQGGAA